MYAFKVLTTEDDVLVSWWAKGEWKRIYIPYRMVYPMPGTKLFVFDSLAHCMKWLDFGKDIEPDEISAQIWRVWCPSLEPIDEVGYIWSWRDWMKWWHDEYITTTPAPTGTCVTPWLKLEEKVWPREE